VSTVIGIRSTSHCREIGASSTLLLRKEVMPVAMSTVVPLAQERSQTMNRPTTMEDHDLLEEAYAEMMRLAENITGVLNYMSNDSERGYLAF
jgi:hypothetical protein